MKAAEQLVEHVRAYGSCAVAFSAGVDSTVVAKAAHLALGERAVAVTGVGPALAEGELDAAREFAALIGVRHVEAATDEIHQAGYVANAPDRCFHCKTELYTHVRRVALQLRLAVIANGANTDDQGDYRPGMRAADDFRVRSPLVECGLDKAAVRALAAHWSLPVWNKPAAPCLASRIAYGQQVTPERLRMIDLAEQELKRLGIQEVRVRYHEGDHARIEVPRDAIAEISRPAVRDPLFARITALGFRTVEIDPEGYRSGSLNEVLPVEALARWSG